MSSSGMLLLLLAPLLHSARFGSAEQCNSTMKNEMSQSRNESCSEALLCTNDSVKALLKNLRNFACQHPSVNSTCVCDIQGFGLLAVQVLPSQNDTGLKVDGLHNINANFTVFAKDCSCTVLCCINATDGSQLELLEKVWMILKQPQVIAAFLTGVLLSAFVCFLGGKCHRKKARGSRNKADGVATSQDVPLGAAGHSAVEPREVEYSDIDFSRWNRNSPAVAEQVAAETEYAELQKDGSRQEPEENSGDSGEDVAVAIDEEETEQ